MKVSQEVYKVVIEKSIRGTVVELADDGFFVLWQYPSDNKKEFCYNSALSNEVFESERELIKSCGNNVRELAPPLEKDGEYAIDFYGKSLKKGDYVIAMDDEPLYLKVEGKINRIYTILAKGYEGISFIDLEDEDGNIFYKKAVSNLFSTSERFSET